MNVLILAAGYATRLYPLTLNKAKPLLEIAGKPMIERIVEQLGSVDRLGIIYVVTNAKFAAQFEAWASGVQSRHAGLRIKIINDESTSDADKLGAIGDIRLVLQKSDASRDDLIVIAGDNLFSEPIDGFIEFARGKEAAVAVFDVGSREAIKKYASVSLNQEGVITRFEEKPQDPKSTLAALALYFYSRGVLPLVTQYIDEGNNPDQPGRFLEWLYTRRPVHTFEIKGQWLDIGSKETLEQADKLFRGEAKIQG